MYVSVILPACVYITANFYSHGLLYHVNDALLVLRFKNYKNNMNCDRPQKFMCAYAEKIYCYLYLYHILFNFLQCAAIFFVWCYAIYK